MGAGELLIIAVIGLLVLGPERLPIAIRTVGGWIRMAKDLANGLTQEINHELNVQQLHQNLHKAEQQGLKNLSPELSESVETLKANAESVNRSYAHSNTIDSHPAQSDNAASQHCNEPQLNREQVERDTQHHQHQGSEMNRDQSSSIKSHAEAPSSSAQHHQ